MRNIKIADRSEWVTSAPAAPPAIGREAATGARVRHGFRGIKALVFALALVVVPTLATNGVDTVDAGGACLRLVDGQFNAPGSDLRNRNGEWVKVKNTCDRTVSLKGWRIRDLAGHTYRFASSVRLEARSALKLHTGSGTNREGHVYWGRSRAVWNNKANERAYLLDSAGVRVSTWPRTTRTFVAGVNINGPSVTLGDRTFRSYSAAADSGFADGDPNLSRNSVIPRPDVNDGLATLLADGAWTSGTWRFRQKVPDGTYQLFLYTMEDRADDSQAFNVRMEGRVRGRDVGRLKVGEWKRWGAFESTVTDGALTVDLVPTGDKVQVMALEVWRVKKPGTPKEPPSGSRAADPAPTATPTPIGTPTPTAKPAATPAATAKPAATPTPAPAATPSAGCTRTVGGFTSTAVNSARDAAGSGGVVCFPAGTYSASLTASVGGQTWRLDPAARLTGSVTISGNGVEVVGGEIVRPTSDRWSPSVAVKAHDVTIRSVVFRGGGTGVGVYGKDRARIVSSRFTGLSGSAISIWSEGVGADDTIIQGNTIVQSVTYRVSPITSRGNESSASGGIQNARTVIRQNTIDSGPGDTGWFGIELKQSRGAVIEGNNLKGGSVLLSLPETDAAVIRNNTFDMRGSSYWGVEIANADDVVVDGNTFLGDGATAGDHAISLNNGSLRTRARSNTVSNIRTFFDVSGDGHTVTDNCFRAVANEYEYRSSGGANITFARNGPCS